MCISDYMQTTFFHRGRFLKKLADVQYSFITKGSIYHIKYMSIQPFTMEEDWPKIGTFNGKYLLLEPCKALFSYYNLTSLQMFCWNEAGYGHCTLQSLQIAVPMRWLVIPTHPHIRILMCMLSISVDRVSLTIAHLFSKL